MFRTFLVTAALLAAAANTPASGQESLPATLQNLKPHEIVEAITSESKTVGLTPEQLGRLDSLHVAVRDERHQWKPLPGYKAHTIKVMKPMISADQAYADAMAVLTPTQQKTLVNRFNDPAYTPVVPSLSDDVPPALEGLKPHEIVQVFGAERQKLSLTGEQVAQLDSLHVAVRDEPHQYVKGQHGPKGPPHKMMEPMISQRRAYNDALSYLTKDQQLAADRLFRSPGYKAPAIQASK
jgi:hypothetical protein